MPVAPRFDSVQCLSLAGLHRMAYVEWGDAHNPRVLICVHGLTRLGRDFDRLAQALAEHYRVVCPDVVGRGRSDWLRDPNYYVIPQYVSDMAGLTPLLYVEHFHWVGTSKKLAQEQMNLYKEMGINPLGSCLPTLIQFPIIIGLYQAIIRALAVTPIQLLDFSTHIRPLPFLNASALIPLNNRFLWMDLSQPERLMVFGFGIPVLAILVVITTYMQSKLMTPMTQPGDQGAQMTKAMNLYMPFLMGWLAYSFSSGLALYFLASNVFTILQYAAMGKLQWSNLLPTRKPRAG